MQVLASLSRGWEPGTGAAGAIDTTEGIPGLRGRALTGSAATVMTAATARSRAPGVVATANRMTFLRDVRVMAVTPSFR